MIVTTKADDINKVLLEEFKTGTTLLPAIGGYSNDNKTVIYFIVSRFEIYRMTSIVHDIDPSAFLTISEVADVLKGK